MMIWLHWGRYSVSLDFCFLCLVPGSNVGLLAYFLPFIFMPPVVTDVIMNNG